MDYNNLTDEEIAIARFKCDESLLFFTRFWFMVLRGCKFITNWHHDDICSSLESIENYELEFLGINIPPRFSKTEIAAVNFIARGLGLNPSGNYLYITASDELRSETSTRIRDIVSHSVFKKMYGVELKPDQTAKNLWRTRQGGGLKTATIFGQITGFGAGQMVDHSKELEDYIRAFEGCIVLDDLDKIDDAGEGNANNKKVLRIIGNTVLSRVNSEDTPIINIQQRAGLNDTTSYFKKLYANNKKAKHLVYPIIYNGESLWPWKMSMEKINQLKHSAETRHTFETQYMQNPQRKEGVMFKCDKRFTKLSKEPDLKIFVIDPADEGTDLFAGGYFEIMDKRVYMPDVICNRKNKDWNLEDIAQCINSNKVNYAFIESNGLGTGFKKDLNKLISITATAVHNRKNKHMRINAEAGFINDNFWFIENHDRHSDPEEHLTDYELFMFHLSNYTKDGRYEPDDPPDMLALASRIIRQKFSYLFD